MIHSVRSLVSHVTALALLGAVAGAPSTGRAQTSSDEKKFAAYLALSATPMGALPPLVTRSMAGGPVAIGSGGTGTSGTAGSAGLRPQIAFRYGRGTFGESPDDVHINAFAATGMLAAGEAATLTGTVGIEDPDCREPDCDAKWMFSVGGDLALSATQLGTEPASPRLTVGLNGELGYARLNNNINAVGVTAGLPIALVANSGTMRIVPFLTPALGYGRTRLDVGQPMEGGVRFLLGGGLSLLNITSGVSVNVGFQKIFFSVDIPFFGPVKSKTMFGASVTLGR